MIDLKLYLVSFVLCGEVVSFSCQNPIKEVCTVAKGAEVSNVTIKPYKTTSRTAKGDAGVQHIQNRQR